MRTVEIYKLRTHRTPLVCAMVLLVGVLAPSVVMVWYEPTDSATYTDAYMATFEVLSLVLAVVFGGWLLGTEYRQGTVKRLLTSEPRRLRALATKGIVGAVALSGALVSCAGIGWAAARVVGSANDVTVAWDGRSVLAFTIIALIAATTAYGLSAITRSDSFAMVGTVVLVLVIEPLISLIPTIGEYTIGSAIVAIESALIEESAGSLPTISTGAAIVTVAAWLLTFLAAGAVLFTNRDV